jgi:S1-C subfamily serine protease
MGLAALLCGYVEAQTIGPKAVTTYETSRPKGQLDDIMSRIFLVRSEVKLPDGKTEDSIGTAFLYQRDEQFNYYITNDHVVTIPAKINGFFPMEIRLNAAEYVLYNNGLEWEKKDAGKLLYTDQKSDYAIIVSPNNGGAPLAPVFLELDGLSLGEKIYTIGVPNGTLPTLYSGNVAGLDTVAVEEDDAIPGYRLHVIGPPGVSGSVVFVERKGEYRWAGILHSGSPANMFVQAIPVKTFYETLYALTPDAVCAAQAQSLTTP